jgi:hypothetical protein
MTNFGRAESNCKLLVCAHYSHIGADSTSNRPFWDVVVLTATDEPQAESYRIQLEQKQAAKEIPATK